VQFTVEPSGGETLEPCDYSIQTPGHSAIVTFYRTGVFFIRASTADTHGSPSPDAGDSIVMVTIDDAPPVFSVGAKTVPTDAVNKCNVFTAGQVVKVRLDGSVDDKDEPARKPDDPSCKPGEMVTYTWRVMSSPATAQPKLTPIVDGNCADVPGGTALVVPTFATQVCLWTDPKAENATSMYKVVLEAFDGKTLAMGLAGDGIQVSPDQPPCITGTQLPAGSYVVDRSQPQTFQVTGVADDLDGFGASALHFAWSVWRETDVDSMGVPVWRSVPSHPGSSYTLDASAFGVGEIVKVRVEAIDRTGARAGCDIDDLDCHVTSCAASGATCNQWRTWTLELR
jgi:hypothetical protein